MIITAILGTAAAIGLIAAWVFFDALWFYQVPPKKTKKFKDKRIRRIKC